MSSQDLFIQINLSISAILLDIDKGYNVVDGLKAQSISAFSVLYNPLDTLISSNFNETQKIIFLKVIEKNLKVIYKALFPIERETPKSWNATSRITYPEDLKHAQYFIETYYLDPIQAELNLLEKFAWPRVEKLELLTSIPEPNNSSLEASSAVNKI